MQYGFFKFLFVMNFKKSTSPWSLCYTRNGRGQFWKHWKHLSNHKAGFYPFLNHLFQEFYFTSIFEILPKIGSYRLPTHRRGAYRKIFPWSFLISELKFKSNVLCRWRYEAKGFLIFWWHYTLDMLLTNS